MSEATQTDDQRIGQHLVREWIDTELYEKLRKVLTQHYKKKVTDNQLGEMLATLTTITVASVTSAPVQPNHRLAIMADVVNFMHDLFNRGWDIGPGKERSN